MRVHTKNAGTTCGLLLVISLALCGLAHPAWASLNNALYDSVEGWSYGIFWNALGSPGGSAKVTQLDANTMGIVDLAGSGGGVQETYVLGPFPLVSPVGQSAVISSLLGASAFDVSGSGLVHFANGTTVGLGDLGLFSGVATTLDVGPSTVFGAGIDKSLTYPIMKQI